MKINGVPVTKPNEEVLILERGEHFLEFRAIAIPDFEEFEKLCPEPKPPGKRTKEGFIPNTNDPGYRQIMANYSAQRMGYMVINSLAPSNIEWDIVKLDDPSTWAKWQDDMKKSGMNYVEISRVLQLVLAANCLDEAKIAKARELFLLGKAAVSEESSSQSSEPASTPSGEPAAE